MARDRGPTPPSTLGGDETGVFDDDARQFSADDEPAVIPAIGPDDIDDDVVVLSWWQNPINAVAIVVAAALCFGMVGWLVADATSGRRGGQVATGFLQDMRVHHEQAVQMGLIYLDRPDADPSLTVVARSIVVGQSLEIGRMVQLLRDMGAPEAAETDEAMTWMGMSMTYDQMDGMATVDELDRLAAAEGAAADGQFVQLMVDHHEGGIHMAEYAAENAESAEVRRMATGMVEGQQGEIIELRGLLG